MTEKRPRSVRMTDDEAWAFVEAGHTGILTTLRTTGDPITLPVWYVVLDRRIHVQTRGKKLQRVRRDPRASFLVEAGRRWAELQAVHLSCTTRILGDDEVELAERVTAALRQKYAAFRTEGSKMPKATRDVYVKVAGAILELTPTGRTLTWDNNHLGVG